MDNFMNKEVANLVTLKFSIYNIIDSIIRHSLSETRRSSAFPRLWSETDDA